MVNLLDDLNKICGGDRNCLAPYTVDRRIKERTVAPYVQLNAKFDILDNPMRVRAGLRYEDTKVTSSALVPIPSGTQWGSANEFNLVYSGKSDFTTFEGSYHNWLPAIDVDYSPISDVKVRASYSHTITRADYASLQAGVSDPFHAARLQWRVEELRSKISDLASRFRDLGFTWLLEAE